MIAARAIVPLVSAALVLTVGCGGSLHVVRIVERRLDGQKLLVRWAPAGSNGWLAHYDFTVGDNQITSADLQYA